MSAIESFSQTGLVSPFVFGGDIGGTKSSFTLDQHDPTAVSTMSTPETWQESVEQVAQIGAQLGKRAGRKIDSFGCAVAGEVSADGSHMVRAGDLHARGWTGVDLQAEYAAALDLPREAVTLVNDATAAAHAERQIAREKKLWTPESLVVVQTVSTGNGGATATEKAVVNREFGHRLVNEKAPVACGCGAQDAHYHAEAWLGGKSVSQPGYWGQRMETVPADDLRWSDYRAQFNALQVGLVEDLTAEHGKTPDTMSYFGSVVMKGHGVFDSFHSVMREMYPEVRVVPAAYGDRSSLCGAIVAAQEVQL